MIERGYVSPFFLRDGENEVFMKDPAVIIINGEMNDANFDKYLPLIDMCVHGKQKLLILADDFDHDVTTILLNNWRKHGCVIPVRNPSFGDKRRDLIQDMAKMVGCDVLDDGFEMSDESVQFAFGQANSIRVAKTETIIQGGHGDKEALDSRCNALREALKEPTLNDFNRKVMTERLAKMNSAIAIISVSAATEVEMLERKDRADDAVGATRAALEEGYVPGGGTSLLRLAKQIESELHDKQVTTSERIGITLALEAMEAPIRQIAANGALSPEVIAMKVMDKSDWTYGFNARSEEYGDMVKMGIIDPVKVTRGSLEYAASVATMMLTTQVMIGIKPRASVYEAQ